MMKHVRKGLQSGTISLATASSQKPPTSLHLLVTQDLTNIKHSLAANTNIPVTDTAAWTFEPQDSWKDGTTSVQGASAKLTVSGSSSIKLTGFVGPDSGAMTVSFGGQTFNISTFANSTTPTGIGAGAAPQQNQDDGQIAPPSIPPAPSPSHPHPPPKPLPLLKPQKPTLLAATRLPPAS
ncbi:hypothetical protein BT69DRAFT_456980 [Atractiella rhizophila]|nr:hypothetical protein BT69DRAFT_456980 [Atractiella rhizophila]